MTMTMSGLLYIACLLVLMLGPPITYWRRGLKVSLLLVAVEFAGVLLLVFAANYFGLLPEPPKRGPMPETNVLEHIKKNHAEQVAHLFAMLMVFVMIPLAAVLIGGTLSLAGSAAFAIRQSIQGRTKKSV